MGSFTFSHLHFFLTFRSTMKFPLLQLHECQLGALTLALQQVQSSSVKCKYIGVYCVFAAGKMPKYCFSSVFFSCVLPGPAHQPIKLPHKDKPASASDTTHQNPHVPSAHQPQSPPILLLWRLLLLLLHPSLPAPSSRHPHSHHRNHSSHSSTHSGPNVQHSVAAPRVSCWHGDHQTRG